MWGTTTGLACPIFCTSDRLGQYAQHAPMRLRIDGRPQRNLVGCAFRAHAQLLRYAVAHRSGHQPVSSELSAHNRNKSPNALPGLVIQQRKAAADLTASRRLRVLSRIQRPGSAEDAQDARVHEVGDHFVALPQQLIDLLGSGDQSLRAWNQHRTCSQQAYRACWNNDVGIARRAATVDDSLAKPVIEHHQRAFVAADGQVHASQ